MLLVLLLYFAAGFLVNIGLLVRSALRRRVKGSLQAPSLSEPIQFGVVAAVAVLLPFFVESGFVFRGAMTIAGYRVAKAQLSVSEQIHKNIVAVSSSKGIGIHFCQLPGIDRYLYEGEILLHRIGHTAYVKFTAGRSKDAWIVLELPAEGLSRVAQSKQLPACVK